MDWNQYTEASDKIRELKRQRDEHKRRIAEAGAIRDRLNSVRRRSPAQDTELASAIDMLANGPAHMNSLDEQIAQLNRTCVQFLATQPSTPVGDASINYVTREMPGRSAPSQAPPTFSTPGIVGMLCFWALAIAAVWWFFFKH